MITAIEKFLIAAKMLPIDLRHVNENRRIAEWDFDDPLYHAVSRYLGDQFVEVVAHVYTVSWLVDPENPNGCADYRDMIMGAWSPLVAACPAIRAFWPECE